MLLFYVCFVLFLAKLQLALSLMHCGFFWWNSKKRSLGDRDLQSFWSLKCFCMDLTHSARGPKAFSPDQNFQYFFCLLAFLNLLYVLAYIKVSSQTHEIFIPFSTEFQSQVDVSCWCCLLTPGSWELQEQAQKGSAREEFCTAIKMKKYPCINVPKSTVQRFHLCLLVCV